MKNIEDFIKDVLKTYKDSLHEEIFRQHAYEMLLEDKDDFSIEQFKEHLSKRVGLNAE